MKNKVVFKYSYSSIISGYCLMRAYRPTKETNGCVQVQHWFGKRWHPKNEYWRIEEIKEIK